MPQMVARARRKPPLERGDTTNERLAKAEGYTITDDMRRRWMRDSPISRAALQGRITGAQFQAGVKFAECWHGSGFSGSIGSFDLNRIMSRDTTQFSFLAISEDQAGHRLEYLLARRALGWKLAGAIEAMVCHEIPLQMWGHFMGSRSKSAAIERGGRHLKEGLQILCGHWRIANAY